MHGRDKKRPEAVHLGVAVVAKMVNAVTLEVTSCQALRVRIPPTASDSN